MASFLLSIIFYYIYINRLSYRSSPWSDLWASNLNSPSGHLWWVGLSSSSRKAWDRSASLFLHPHSHGLLSHSAA